MAVKLYPPLIEGTIPAFSGTVLTVPFSLNRAVANSEITGFILKIKTVQGGTVLGTFQQTDEAYYDLTTNLNVRFNIKPLIDQQVLNIGQYYKVQIAFLNGLKNNPTIGFYSTVGIVKYTAEPNITINKLEYGQLNSHNYVYTGSYSQLGGDPTEKLYSTRFYLYTYDNQLLIDSGEILHNTSKDDNSYDAYESYTIARDLNENEVYYLQMVMTTSNGLITSSKRYKIIQAISTPPEINGYLKAKNNFEDGYIQLSLIGNKLEESGLESSLIGNFCVSRAASNENYIWHEIFSFSAVDPSTTRVLWNDYTVEQGVSYKYSIQQFNSFKVYSSRIISNEEKADFEDAFLYDGMRQLKIRYNPKVASFKTDILESKMETIGSKHPFIFRNGNVYYKEFPISGLISYKMDDNEKFLTKEELGLLSSKDLSKFSRKSTEAEEDRIYQPETFDLVSYNIFSERIFKMCVLDWLNNGETKLFKSPSEGNYVVRLMNNSMSPSDQLGRMLHTFNSTAYEVEEFSYEILNKMGLISTEEISTVTSKWKTMEVAGHSKELDEILESLETYIQADVCTVISPELRSRIINSVPNADKYIFPYNKSYIIGTWNELLQTPVAAFTTPEEQKVLQDILNLHGKVTYATEGINSALIYSIDVKEMMPGTILEVVFQDEDLPQEIQIGVTGAYKATFEKPAVSVNIKTISLEDGTLATTTGLQGQITYSYNDTTDTLFSLIQSYIIRDMPCKQFIGTPTPKEIYLFETNEKILSTNLIDFLVDSKTTITSLNQMHFIARPQRMIFMNILDNIPEYIINYKNGEDNNYYIEEALQTYPETIDYNGKYYYDMDCTQEVDLNALDPYFVYALCYRRNEYFQYENGFGYDGEFIFANYSHGYYQSSDGKKYQVFSGFYLDGLDNHKIYPFNQYSNSFTIDGEEIDLTEQKELLLKNFNNDTVKSIEIPNGIICEISYQDKINTFSLESEDKLTDANKKLYEFSLNKLKRFGDAMVAIGNIKEYLLIYNSNTSTIKTDREREYMIIAQAISGDSVLYNILGGPNLTVLNWGPEYTFTPELEQQLIAHEENLRQAVRDTYKNFIYSLDAALYTYERGNE